MVQIKTADIVITAIGASLYAVLLWVATSFSFLATIYNTALYPPSGIAAPWGIWFGVWGILAVWFGNLIGFPFWGLPMFPTGAIIGISEILEAFVPALPFKLLKLDPSLRDRKSLGIYGFSSIVGCLLNATFGVTLFALMGVIPWVEAFTWLWWGAWATGDIIFALLLGIPLMRVLGPFVVNSGLYIPGWIRTSRTS